MGADARRAGLGVAESGSATTKSAQAMAATGGPVRIARRTTRRVHAAALALRPPTAQQGGHIDTGVRRHRRRTWDPRRLATRGTNRPRMAVRVRHPAGSWRSGGKGEGGCGTASPTGGSPPRSCRPCAAGHRPPAWARGPDALGGGPWSSMCHAPSRLCGGGATGI